MNLSLFQTYLGLESRDDVFAYLASSFRDTISGFDHFVDWKKVWVNTQKLEVSLHILNYLFGKEDVENEFRKLLHSYPEIVKAIPILIAERHDKFKILETDSSYSLEYREYFLNERNLTPEDINSIVDFCSKSGILDLIKNNRIQNFVDYTVGVEVGIDTNSRKNRTGKRMENITETFIQKACNETSSRYLREANAQKIRQSFGYHVSVDKNNRRFDFAIDTGSRLILIETNYYGGGGSKLKATAGEYKGLYDSIRDNSKQHTFVWITDGKGWETALNPLRETFNYIDYILNLKMLEQGLLEAILRES